MSAMSESDLKSSIEEVALLVHAAEDRKDDREFLAKVHLEVDALGTRYQKLEASLPETERMKLDRVLGRRVRDLKRLASLLPRMGQVSGSTPDRVAGVSEVGERRITGVSWRSESVATLSRELRVGADIEAWCGVCKEITTHSIVAMLGNEPKQVACQTCSARHNYRTGPARKISMPTSAASNQTERAQARRAEEQDRALRARQAALAAQVYAAEEVVPFDPAARYKVGQIIEHPEHGRGKVENVLRSSMLVRFARGGLKSVMLI